MLPRVAIPVLAFVLLAAFASAEAEEFEIFVEEPLAFEPLHLHVSLDVEGPLPVVAVETSVTPLVVSTLADPVLVSVSRDLVRSTTPTILDLVSGPDCESIRMGGPFALACLDFDAAFAADAADRGPVMTGPPRSAGATASAVEEPAAALDVAAVAGLAAVAMTSVAAPAAPWAWSRLRRLGVLAALYTRLSRERLLSHEGRDALLSALRANPGAAIADLAERTAMPRNTVTHHLHMLERQGMVASRREGRVRLYFPAGSGAVGKHADALAALRHDTTRTMARTIGETPGVDQRALCTALGLAAPLAHWHAARLVQSNVVMQVREGRRVRYYPGDAFHLVPASFGPGV